MRVVKKFLDTHALKTFFDVQLLTKTAESVSLKLSLKNDIADMAHQGVLGSIVDCAARLAGYTSIGQCFLSECEISVHRPTRAQEFIVEGFIVAAQEQLATYCCEIYSVAEPTNLLVAESQGTIRKIGSRINVIL